MHQTSIPDPNRPQLWATRHPWENGKLQINIVYPDGKYEFNNGKTWRTSEVKWEENEEIDDFLDNL